MLRDRVSDQPPLRELGHQAVQVRKAQEQVYLGDLLFELFLVALHQASDRHDGLDGAVGFQLGGGEHRIDGLALRGVDEAAGVDEDDVGARQVGRHDGAVAHELGDQSLGVDRRLVAAEGDDAQLHPR